VRPARATLREWFVWHSHDSDVETAPSDTAHAAYVSAVEMRRAAGLVTRLTS